MQKRGKNSIVNLNPLPYLTVLTFFVRIFIFYSPPFVMIDFPNGFECKPDFSKLYRLLTTDAPMGIPEAIDFVKNRKTKAHYRGLRDKTIENASMKGN